MDTLTWIKESDLPDDYPRALMLPFSEVVEGVRLFPSVLPSRDAARALNVTLSSVQKYCRMNRLPAVKTAPGRRGDWLITPQAIAAFKRPERGRPPIEARR